MKLLSALLLLVPQLNSCTAYLFPMDCSDIFKQNRELSSGVYFICPCGPTSCVQVYCDMKSFGGGWTVFQRRMDGSVNFYRPWMYYKSGFGNAAGEYWLGLENLFHLCHRRKFELVVVMEDFEGHQAYARYCLFSVGPESLGYPLHVSGFSDGEAGDSLSYNSGQKFSTFDNRQDCNDVSCPRLFLGAWWYKKCHKSNPNGVYRWGFDDTLHGVGVEWSTFKGDNYSLKYIAFMIRPVHH
ncbi:PREDICTED: microfibril-associated glycoprotein 4-like [Cyprinodon variegatus]|uniref:Microfibril associated protein 4 n=1 Tax=Cyprinodon variegatus TaxID=28743 RepID=A0A3Q2D717_CYPVA|nr:PREDICTED: microfibril-associated glycoprotein 4-like [Cyprinodon variegatus]